MGEWTSGIPTAAPDPTFPTETWGKVGSDKGDMVWGDLYRAWLTGGLVYHGFWGVPSGAPNPWPGKGVKSVTGGTGVAASPLCPPGVVTAGFCMGGYAPLRARGADTRFRVALFSSLPRRGPAQLCKQDLKPRGTAPRKTRQGGRDGHDGRFGALSYSQAVSLASQGLGSSVGGSWVLGVQEELPASRYQPCSEGQVARQSGREWVPLSQPQGHSALGVC